jgi:hypothetical protein
MAKTQNKDTLFSAMSSAEFAELRAVMRDPWEFSKHIKVIHPVRGRVPFLLYPFQKKVLWHFLNDSFNIILKFRQAGITELISMYCLWLAMYHPNKNILIISIKDRVAKKVLRKIKYMYRNLPEHLKVRVVNGRSGEIGTATEIEFGNGSIISSIPTTEDAGRSEGLSLLVIDEAAIIKWANIIWAAVWPTLSTGGKAIVNSTPYGVGNWFHSLWVNAVAGGNPFNPIRLRWQMHPERDEAWYEQQRQVLGARRTAQEIDGDFLTSGNTVFDLLDIRAIEESLEDNPPTKIEMNGQLLTFKEWDGKSRTYIGADVATGRSRDYSAFSIMDEKGEELAAFKGRIPTDKYADLLLKKAKEYGNSMIAPEGNDIGLATVMDIQGSGYPNLYYATALVKEKGKKKPKEERIPGWLTTKKNRPIIIDGLEEDIRNGLVDIKNPFFVQEAYTFIYDEANRPIALGKRNQKDNEDLDDDETFTDDSILGESITNYIRKGGKKGLITAPR